MLSRHTIFAVQRKAMLLVRTTLHPVLVLICVNLGMYKTFNERAVDVEVLIRGNVLRQCAVTELALLRMIIFCNEEKPDIEKDIFDFKSLMFFAKIGKAQKLLKEQYPDIEDKNQELFNELYELKDFRNLIAHSMFEFDQSLPNPTAFILWEVIKPPDKIQFFDSVGYTIDDVDKMVKRIKKANKVLLGINIIIEDNFNRRFPGFLG